MSYKCSSCGKEYRSPMHGICRGCGQFGTVDEVKDTPQQAQLSVSKTPPLKPENLQRGKINDFKRVSTGLSEFDRVLGGGFVQREVALFAGEPGSGKSSLSLIISHNLAASGLKVLYVSGEESLGQVSLRAQRMGIYHESLLFISTTSLEAVVSTVLEEKPDFLVVDSLQVLTSENVKGAAGSISQSKEAGHTLTQLAKTQGFIALIINQLVKSNDFAGSESVKHIVDVTLMLDSDRNSPLKVLRSHKNRFGNTYEAGFFQHTDSGVIEVKDPSGIMMDNAGDITGSSVGFISEGVRQMPVEIQSLCVHTELPNPRRQFNGVDWQRAQIVCAILEKYLKLKLYTSDVFVSTISGIKVSDPLADLSIAAAVFSSAKSKVSPAKTCYVGELTLTGQVRGNYMLQEKVYEAERLGFDRIVVPSSAKSMGLKSGGITIDYISTVQDLKGLFPEK